ncbi:hypothetical protein Cgig2_022597 [Carnegiea gigantea]|uniref:Uncharacterized protein n=1 Tax=Carnegiea gigantea TaxID=171969 RepID=A0A9Q1JMR1_9CARY|nr:hypothetical protein Cgig2_022597 [Carnegiea gigantea]
MDLAQARADLQRDLLAGRARVFQSLSALCSMIDIYNLSTIEIYWLSSKIEEIFGVVETAAKIEELVDVTRLKFYLAKISLVLLKLLTLKVNSITCLEERIRKIQEDLTIQQQSLIKVESKLKSSLDLKKREVEQVKADLAEARFSKLQDLVKKNNYLKSLISSIISFNNFFIAHNVESKCHMMTSKVQK